MSRVVGIAFETDVNQHVRIRTTKRADLAVSRMRQQARRLSDLDQARRLAARRGEKPPQRTARLDILGVVETPSEAGADKLRRALQRAFAAPGSGDLIEQRLVADALSRCRKLGKGLVVHFPEPPPAERRQIFNAPVVSRRWVPDPMMTKANLLEQQARFPEARWIGWTKSDVNLQSLVGGFARVREKTEAQIQGAAEFRNVAERAIIGGAKAIDYAVTRVDSSGPVENREIVSTEDARRKLMGAVTRLGGAGSRLHIVAEKIIVHGMTIAQAAESIAGSSGGAARKRITEDVLSAATILAEEFGFASDRSSRAKMSGWSDGGPQTFTADGSKTAISARRVS
jgi:hypothetical protein